MVALGSGDSRSVARSEDALTQFRNSKMKLVVHLYLVRMNKKSQAGLAPWQRCTSPGLLAVRLQNVNDERLNKLDDVVQRKKFK